MTDAFGAGISGHATPEGTRRFSERHPAAAGHWREARGLHLSSIGLGSYLGSVDDASNRAYEEATLAALESGVNVLDTAINYRGQQSERDLGRAVKRFGRRDEVFVATKGGFLTAEPEPGEDPARSVRRMFLESNLLEAGDVAGGIHAMAPAYLRHEIDRSRRNLGLATIDLYFVHNPETQLHAGVPRATFEVRLAAAFEELERACDAGMIRLYGLATWEGVRVPAGAREHLDLARVLELAAEARAAVGGPRTQHHFGAIELPLNLAMPEALVTPTQDRAGDAVPALEAARAAELIVFASASLLQARLLGRLPPFVREALHAADDVQAALEFARSSPGVTTALVGMGRPDHARANASAMTARPVQPGGVAALLHDPVRARRN